MAEELCKHNLEEYKTLVHFYGTLVLSFAILNLIFAIVATFANILAIRALWKASSIPDILKKLYLSLAISDFGVGVLGQPMFGAVMLVILKKETTGNNNSDVLCPSVLTVCYLSIYLLTSASFFTLNAIAVDRLLAIVLHLRYQELVTPRRAISFLVASWLATVTVAAPLSIFIPTQNHLVVAIFQFVGLFVTTVIYIYIYKIVQYHRNQILVLAQCQLGNHRAMEAIREKKSAISSLFVYIVFLACFLPNVCCIILLTVNDFRPSYLAAYHVSAFFVLLNSSINPLIYCWRYREVREIMKRLLSKFFLNRNWIREMKFTAFH